VLNPAARLEVAVGISEHGAPLGFRKSALGRLVLSSFCAGGNNRMENVL